MAWKRKLPIGIQDFVGLREDGYVYADKTALVYKMVTEGKPYFLARPRRFGKSLLCSTLKAYFEGRKELFDGSGTPDPTPLAIASLETEWKRYPVIHFDLTGTAYTSMEKWQSILNSNLRVAEGQWGRDPDDTTPESQFQPA